MAGKSAQPKPLQRSSPFKSSPSGDEKQQPQRSASADGISGTKKPREAILNLSRSLGRSIHAECQGNRVVTGILRGFDALNNLVLDEAVELFTATDSDVDAASTSRFLGLTLVRGTALQMLHDDDGSMLNVASSAE